MVVSAIVRALQKQGKTNIFTRTHAQLDLTNQADVQQFFTHVKPRQVYLEISSIMNSQALLSV
jgi:GDP-L-fucose synthase